MSRNKRSENYLWPLNTQNDMSFRRISSGPFRDAYATELHSAMSDGAGTGEIERKVIDYLYSLSNSSADMASHHLRRGDAVPIVVHSIIKEFSMESQAPKYKTYTLEEARKLVAELEKEEKEKRSKEPITNQQKLLL